MFACAYVFADTYTCVLVYVYMCSCAHTCVCVCVCSRLLHSGTERAINATCSPTGLLVSLYSSYSYKKRPSMYMLRISMLTTVEEAGLGGHVGSRAWLRICFSLSLKMTKTLVLSAVDPGSGRPAFGL